MGIHIEEIYDMRQFYKFQRYCLWKSCWIKLYCFTLSTKRWIAAVWCQAVLSKALQLHIKLQIFDDCYWFRLFFWLSLLIFLILLEMYNKISKNHFTTSGKWWWKEIREILHENKNFIMFAVINNTNSCFFQNNIHKTAFKRYIYIYICSLILSKKDKLFKNFEVSNFLLVFFLFQQSCNLNHCFKDCFKVFCSTFCSYFFSHTFCQHILY